MWLGKSYSDQASAVKTLQMLLGPIRVYLATVCHVLNHGHTHIKGPVSSHHHVPCNTFLKNYECELQELLVPLVTDTDVKIDVAGFAALSLGLVFTSTCNGDAIEAIIQALMMRGELELSSPFAKFLALGLGLLFLGRQEAVEATVEVMVCLLGPLVVILFFLFS